MALEGGYNPGEGVDLRKVGVEGVDPWTLWVSLAPPPTVTDLQLIFVFSPAESNQFFLKFSVNECGIQNSWMPLTPIYIHLSVYKAPLKKEPPFSL